MLATRTEIAWAEPHVYAALSPTAQIAWPLLAKRAGCEVWVKHENHQPTGAFKVRGGLVWAASFSEILRKASTCLASWIIIKNCK